MHALRSLLRPFTLVFIIIGICLADRSNRDLLSARCKAKCLTDLTIRRAGVAKLVTRVEDDTSDLLGCNSDDMCSQCMKPCEEKFTGVEQCKLGCKDNSFSCSESCQFLKLSMTFKPGMCPAPTEIRGFGALCIQECKKDGDCRQDRKCCANSCGKTCQRALRRDDGLPEVPTGVEVHGTSDFVKLSWHHNANETVVYVVQAKTSKKRNGLKKSVQWKLLAQTVTSPVVFTDLQQGVFFEFRVAAVSMRGSRQFSSPSEAVKFERAPERPGPPVNVTEGISRIRSGKVDVAIYWQPPAHNKVPVSRYKIFWSERLRGVSGRLVSLTEHSETVEGSQLSYTIKQLTIGTTYFVQVQAIVRAGSMRAKSLRSSIFITTFSLDVNKKILTTRSPMYADDPGIVEIFDVMEPYFTAGDLKTVVRWQKPPGDAVVEKYTVHWQPEWCQNQDRNFYGATKIKSATTHSTNFTLYALQYDCQYSVRVGAVSLDGQIGDTSLQYFYTPMCSDVIVMGHEKPECDHEVTKFKLPRRPTNLSYTLLSSSAHNSSVELRWSLAPDDSSTEVHLIWGETQVEESMRLVISQDSAARMVLHKAATRAKVSGLKANKTYIVRLNVASTNGLSAPAFFVFSTALGERPLSPVADYKAKIPTTKSKQPLPDDDTSNGNVCLLSLLLAAFCLLRSIL